MSTNDPNPFHTRQPGAAARREAKARSRSAAQAVKKISPGKATPVAVTYAKAQFLAAMRRRLGLR